MAKAKQATSDFGDAYKELEDIVSWFEREDPDLDEGLKKFERGLALAKLCKDRLSEVENRVTAIKAKFGSEAEDEAKTDALF